MNDHGFHWTPCRGGGGGAAMAVTAAVALLILGSGAAAARAVTGLLVAVAVTAGFILAAIAVILGLWLRVQRRRDAEATAAYTARVQAAEEDRRRRALDRHRQALEIARASAPVIAIDPALIAAVAGAQRRPARVIRGEVER